MNLFKASNQWASRPVDERFWTVEEMKEATKHYADISVQATVRPETLRVESEGKEMLLVGQSGTKSLLTNYAFGQLAARAGAPANYLRQLPGELAATCINTTLPARQKNADDANVLFHKNGSLVTRCITSERYSRIWNYEIAERLEGLASQGWKVPPARPANKIGERTRLATEQDVLSCRELGGLKINVGDTIAPAGLYASDRDMFAFMVDDQHTIKNPLCPETPLARGFFVWNSEVGDKSFGVMTFGYDAVCGNHIVWGAYDVKEIRVRHVGEARYKAFNGVEVELRKYAQSSSSEIEEKIEASQRLILGATKEETLIKLFDFIGKKRIPILNNAMLDEAYDVAKKTPRYGNPNTPWAMSQGLTQLSQLSAYADRRNDIDKAAGKLLSIAF